MNKIEDFIVGRTIAKVTRVNVNEATRRESVDIIHEGIVVQKTSSCLRIYKDAPSAKGGDTSPENSELFPINGKRCFCDVVDTLPENKAMTIPPTIRATM